MARDWRFSKVWAAVYFITGVVIVILGAAQSNVALIVIGVLLVPFGVGLDVVLKRRRRPERRPVRRV